MGVIVKRRPGTANEVIYQEADDARVENGVLTLKRAGQGDEVVTIGMDEVSVTPPPPDDDL